MLRVSRGGLLLCPFSKGREVFICSVYQGCSGIKCNTIIMLPVQLQYDEVRSSAQLWAKRFGKVACACLPQRHSTGEDNEGGR
jgi:hypothetical protein